MIATPCCRRTAALCRPGTASVAGKETDMILITEAESSAIVTPELAFSAVRQRIDAQPSGEITL